MKKRKNHHHQLTLSKHGEQKLSLLEPRQYSEYVELELHRAYSVVDYGVVLDYVSRVRRRPPRGFIVVIVVIVVDVGP